MVRCLENSSTWNGQIQLMMTTMVVVALLKKRRPPESPRHGPRNAKFRATWSTALYLMSMVQLPSQEASCHNFDHEFRNWMMTQ
jgi:hypothetical protein